MTATESFVKCAKCGIRPAGAPAGQGGNKWCNECRAQWQRDYQDTRITMANNKGFYEGVKAMRDLLAQEFERLGWGAFTGDEIALLIRQAPGPRHAEDEPKPPKPV
jgi:hypothetical protein